MAESFNSKLPSVGFHFLQLLKADVTQTSFYKVIQENPFYPSLYSLSETLNKFNIETNAFKIEAEKLPQIVPPFIAFVNDIETGEDFVSVTSITENTVHYSPDGKSRLTSALKDFQLQFRNVVLLANLTTISGEPGYEKKRHQEAFHQRLKYFFITASLISLLLISLQFAFSSDAFFASISLLIIIYAGLLTSVLLLIFEIDKSNAFVRNICTGGSSKVNCNAVLESSASGIFGVSWSEIGFFFFAGLLLFTIFPVLPFQAKIPILSILFTASAFYIPFSIYYQYKVVKQWCRLCLAIQFILFAGVTWSVVNYWSKNIFFEHYLFSDLFFAILCFLIPVTGWFFLKPLLKKAKDADNFSNAHKRLLYNPDIFKSILEQQPTAADGWEHLGIDIGPSTAENTIIKVCNPFCGPCAEAHMTLEKLLEQTDTVRLKIIFNATSDDRDQRSKPVKHLLSIAEENDAQQTKLALDDWYTAEEKNYDKYVAKHPLLKNLNNQNEKVEAMRKWCEKSEITFTPTIFINGWRLPEMYSVEELKNILSGQTNNA